MRTMRNNGLQRENLRLGRNKKKPVVRLRTTGFFWGPLGNSLQRSGASALQLRQRQSRLVHVFAALIFVRGLAHFIALQEKQLGDTFVGIHFRR